MSQPPQSPGTPPPEPDPPGNRPPGSAGDRLVNESAGFFRALFDFGFHHFVTPMIVRFVYVLATIGLGLFYLVLVISGFASDEPAAGVGIMIGGALAFVVYLALIRMTLELYLSIVRMSEDIHKGFPPR